MSLKILRYYQEKKKEEIQHSFINKFVNRNITKKQFFEICNKWLRRRLLLRKIFHWEEKNNNCGLGVFVIRNNAIELELINKIRILIEKYGFEIIVLKYLNLKETTQLINATPSYKWQSNGVNKRGYPEVCIAVFDLKPIFIRKQRYMQWLKYYPYLDNLRLIFKHSIRSSVLRTLPLHQHSNLIHATDNSNEACLYIKATMPEKEKYINKWIKKQIKA